MIADPRFAPKRTDLPWLRRRRLPRAAVPAPSPEQAHSAVTDFMTGHATHHEHHEPPPSPAAQPSPPAHPPIRATSSSSLDLDRPTPPAPAAPPPTPPTPPTPPAPPTAPSRPSSSSLDLDEPPPPAAAPSRPASSSLDLDEPAPPPSRPAAPVPAPSSAPRRRVRVDDRVKAGERKLLTVSDPTVTLTRLQSGIGTLTFEAACSAEVGDLRIGCAYELESGMSSTVQLTQGNRMAPPASRRPVLVASHERFETVSVDLRQCRELRRLIVYAFSEGRAPLNWGGTLVVTTFGGARVELPLESLQSGDAAVFMSLYNVDGEFVLRAEMLTLFGDVREACRTFGFDRITWLDDRSPVE